MAEGLSLPSRFKGRRLPIPHYWQPLLPASYSNTWIRELTQLTGTVCMSNDNGDQEQDVALLLDSAAPGVLKGLIVRGVYTGETDPTVTVNDAADIATLEAKLANIESWGFTPDLVVVDIEEYYLGNAPAEDPDRTTWLTAREAKWTLVRDAILAQWPGVPISVYSKGWAIPQVNETTWGVSYRYGDYIDTDSATGDFICTVFHRLNRPELFSTFYDKRAKDKPSVARNRNELLIWLGQKFTNSGTVNDWDGTAESKVMGEWVRDLIGQTSEVSHVFIYPSPDSAQYDTSDTWWDCLSAYAEGLLTPRSEVKIAGNAKLIAARQAKGMPRLSVGGKVVGAKGSAGLGTGNHGGVG